MQIRSSGPPKSIHPCASVVEELSFLDMDDRTIGYPILAALIAVLVGTWLYVAHIINASPTYRVIRFDRIGNLRIDDPVKVQGITVGEVASISPSNGKVAVRVRAFQPFDVHRGYIINNVDRGLMGDRMISIEPGDPSRPTVPIADTLNGAFHPGISEWVGRAWKLRGAVDSLSRASMLLMVGTEDQPAFKDRFQRVVEGVEVVTDRLLAFAVAGHRDLTWRLDTLSSFVNATGTVVNAAAALGPEYINNISEGISKLEAFVAELEQVLTGLAALTEKLGSEESLLWSKRLGDLTESIKDIRMLIRDIGDGATKLKLRISRMRE
ncbi:MAG: MCE family protein [Chitinivibrionales bacterium]|nr:MCE family protein [Chitinivibrionales bacterium]